MLTRQASTSFVRFIRVSVAADLRDPSIERVTIASTHSGFRHEAALSDPTIAELLGDMEETLRQVSRTLRRATTKERTLLDGALSLYHTLGTSKSPPRQLMVGRRFSCMPVART